MKNNFAGGWRQMRLDEIEDSLRGSQTMYRQNFPACRRAFLQYSRKDFSLKVERSIVLRAGVTIAKDDHSRFGWHNLRHSLATFFASNEVHPSVIQTMLRHTKSQTTARYIHAVNTKQIEAQGKYLDAIKIGTKHPEQAA